MKVVPNEQKIWSEMGTLSTFQEQYLDLEYEHSKENEKVQSVEGGFIIWKDWKSSSWLSIVVKPQLRRPRETLGDKYQVIWTTSAMLSGTV